MSDNWKQVQVIDQEGSIIPTVMDGDEVISIELLEAEDAALAETCAVTLGFSTAAVPA